MTKRRAGDEPTLGHEGRGRRAPRVLLIGVLVAVILALPTAVGPNSRPAGVPVRPATLVSPINSTANLSLNAPGLNVSVPAGTVLSVSYWLAYGSVSPSTPSVVVGVPTVTARMPTTAGAVEVSLVARNVTVTPSAGPSAPAAGVNVTLPATSFAATPAHLTSSQFAVLYDLPLGSGTLRFQWVWTLQPPTGPETKGWSALATISPAPSATIVLVTPSPIPAGTPFTVCTVGPIAGLVLQLRVDLPDGATLSSSSGPVAFDANGRFCLASGVSASTAPTAVDLRLWVVSPFAALLHQVGGSVGALPFGWIAGSVRPASASVTIDGIPITSIGTAGNFSVAVGQGLHEVTASAVDGPRLSESVRVAANQTTSITLVLPSGPTGGVASNLGPILVGTAVVGAVVALAAFLLVPKWRRAIPTATIGAVVRRVRGAWGAPRPTETVGPPSSSWSGDAPWSEERSERLPSRP